MKELKNSKEVRKFFAKKNNGVIAYKGGYAVVINKVVKEIFINKGAEQNANKRLKQLT